MNDLLTATNEHLAKRKVTLARQYGLTPRESEVCQWLLAGKSLPEVSDILGNRLPTVKHQTASIYRKFGVATRAQLLVKVLANIRE
jgi:DNA-binding CsgD family transcriptional regulator